MTGARSFRRLARALLDAPAQAGETAMREALSGLTRRELKGLLAALREEDGRRSVRVSVALSADRPAAETLAPLYKGRAMEVSTDPSLGAGMVVAAGDDIIDASVKGMIHAAVEGMRRK